MELKHSRTTEVVDARSTFNRTLWNWNHGEFLVVMWSAQLLIVPYGIETAIRVYTLIIFYRLLIVPYGIETIINLLVTSRYHSFNRTLWNWNACSGRLPAPWPWSFNRTLWNWNRLRQLEKQGRLHLLIVPYGIETNSFVWLFYCGYPAFNRTLWNWNYSWKACTIMLKMSFNRTLWNWNGVRAPGLPQSGKLLIVPYGIETRNALQQFNHHVIF